MIFVQTFRQLYLLLWKNYVLRKRNKIRVVVEILWPLFLFLILMWVRTRGLKANEPPCNFAERPLPSGGILPFIRSYICELNNSCSRVARESFYDQSLIELTHLSFDALQFINDPETSSSLSTIFEFFGKIVVQRNLSAQITSRLTLSQSLNITENQFEQLLNKSNLFPDVINQQVLNQTLFANPNFNYLYSNYSRTYQEPISQFIQFKPAQNIINILYGPDLDKLDIYRDTNRVGNATWLRSQMCARVLTMNQSDPIIIAAVNYLLRGTDQAKLAEYLCTTLNDTQLEALFTLISSEIDFTKVKKLVHDKTSINSTVFLNETYAAILAYYNLEKKLQESGLLSKYNLTTFKDLYEKFSNFTPNQICPGSKLSLFDIISLIRTADSKTLGRFLNNEQISVTTGRLASIIKNSLEHSSEAVRSTEQFGRSRSFKVTDPFVQKSDSTRSEKQQSTGRFLDTENDLDVAITILHSFNNLNRFNQTSCPARQVEPDVDQSTRLLANSTTNSCFCQMMFSFINSLSQDTQVLFRQVRPMFLGKIVYSPNTTAYENLIKRANATFESMDHLFTLVGKLSETIKRVIVKFDLNNPVSINALEENLLQLAMQYFGVNLTEIGIDVPIVVKQLKFSAQLLEFMHNSFQCIELNKFVGVKDEKAAIDLGLKLIERESFWGAIIFNESQSDSKDQLTLPKIVKYKIRMNASLTHDTTYTQDRIYNFGPSNCLGCNSYFLYGFIFIQDMLEKAIVEVKTNMTQKFGVITQMTPYPCYVNDKFVVAISRTLPMFMVLAWIYTVSMMVKDIVYEKEKRLKEFMRVMGLSNGIHWFTWFLTSFSIMFIVTVLLCLVIKFGKVTTYSDFSVLVVFFACFTVATITQCFLISVFFNKANLAAVTAGIIYFLLYLPYTVLVNYAEVIQPWQKFLASLSSTVAFSYGCEIIASFELQTIGVQWNNFYASPFSKRDGFSMNNICLIMLLDSIIYMLLTWYIEGIAPGEYGIPRKWYFPLQPSYWFGNKCKRKANIDLNIDTASTDGAPKKKNIFSKLFAQFTMDSKEKIIKSEEKREAELRKSNNGRAKFLNESVEKLSDGAEIPGIQIQKLHKVYSRGNNHALKGLSVNFYQNEISAFLGHNGAGKSTTMHLLTGLYQPTSGTAKINNLDITESMDQIRKSLGFVPQHNVLFPQMTVKEHLWFYARLRGHDRKLTLIEIAKLLDDTGLVDKKDEQSKNLSGGMQRKLSVAIAFVGGSKTVILDEPSAGVDPAGRRGIWDLLFKYRVGRTIVISTHHMDEADVLGDRIAIISNGKLIAHGTSYFLKNKFGRGYYLTIAKKQYVDDDSLDEAKTPSDDSGARSLSSLSDSHNSTSTPKSSNTITTATNTTITTTSSERPILANQTRFDRLGSKSELDEFDNEEIDMDDYEQAQLRNEKLILDSLVTEQDKNINEFIKSKIPNAILVENIGSEITYSISNRVEYTKNYEKVFYQLEMNMGRLGIDSMGLSDTTLEEIFIKLAKMPKTNAFQGRSCRFCGIDLCKLKEKVCCFWRDKEAKKRKDSLTPEKAAKYSTYTSLRVKSKLTLVTQQLYALMMKRLHRVKRNVKGFFAEIVLPVLFVCLALAVATLSPSAENRPALELHPWYYQSPNQMFFSKSSSLAYDRTLYDPNGPKVDEVINPDEQPNIEEIEKVYSTFLKSPGPGARCVKGHKIVVTQQAQDYTRANGPRILDCESFDSQLSPAKAPPGDVVALLQSTNYSYSKVSIDCDCSSGFPSCPKAAGGDINYRNVFTLKTKDVMYDLTSRNITDWMLKTEFLDQFFKKRFGGYEFTKPFINISNNFAALYLQNVETFANTFNTLIDQFVMSASDSKVDNITTNFTFMPGADPLVSNENVKIWYNTKGYDSSVSYLNVMNNAFLRAKINELNEQNAARGGTSTFMDPNEHGIVAFNHPMPFTQGQYASEIEKRILIDLFVAVCIIFALSFIPASFLVFLLEERENNSKQLQFVSGVKPYIYWISNFVWDLINYIVPCILCILIFIIFDVRTYMSKENFPCLICLMLLYGWACVPLMYPLNYLFKVPSTAFVVSSSMNVFIGVVSTMTTSVLTQLGDEEPDLLRVNNILKPVFLCLFPHYCLGQGFLEMASLYNVAEVKRSFGYTVEYSPFEFNSVGRNLIALAVQGCVYFTLNLFIEYDFFIRFKPTKNLKSLNLPKIDNEDDDVINERTRILSNEANSKSGKHRFQALRKRLNVNGKRSTPTPATNDNKNVDDQRKNSHDDQQLESTDGLDFIRLVNLTKVYKKFNANKCRFKRHVAVNNLCLGINKGECFGLIGVNGAGKTTTFKMITGELPISGGDVYVNGASVSKQIEKVHQNIGYCPQTDAIMPLLTAREHLMFFARLRGIPEKYVKQVAIWAMHRVGLTVFADRISGDFSGGNKRKLSTAIALVGNPSVICLDEPTSGMDAKARRLLWNDIISLVKENRIVILTSHSMEECEALCTRLVIMVNGHFKCMGSPQHLKTKFGSGYKLAIRLNDESGQQKLFDFMRKHFPSSIMQESHKNLFEFILPFHDTKLSDIFGRIETNRDTLAIKDYSLSQTTLDQIFINFAKLQNEEAFGENEPDDETRRRVQNEVEANIFKMMRSNAVADRNPPVIITDREKRPSTADLRKQTPPPPFVENNNLTSNDKQYYSDSNNNNLNSSNSNESGARRTSDSSIGNDNGGFNLQDRIQPLAESQSNRNDKSSNENDNQKIYEISYL